MQENENIRCENGKSVERQHALTHSVMKNEFNSMSSLQLSPIRHAGCVFRGQGFTGTPHFLSCSFGLLKYMPGCSISIGVLFEVILTFIIASR